jgi:hypothetical protein
MNKPELATSIEDRLLQLSDEDRLLRVLELFQKLSKRSPYFTWSAIRACIRQNRPFPDWVVAYLGRVADHMCAERMRSDRDGDVRETFQWIFEFPKNRPGPGGLFDQGRGLLTEMTKALFAMNFALRLHQGEDPVEARGNAGNDILPDTDDRTLQRYLREKFRLKKLPRTAEGWIPLIDDRNLLALAEQIASFDFEK